MPHFCPLNWLLSPLMLWMWLLTILSLIWWPNSSKFPILFSNFLLYSTMSWSW